MRGATQDGLRVQFKVHFTPGRHGQKRLHSGPPPASAPAPLAGRVPRISRLVALAIRLDGLLQRGEVHDYAELARLGHVTRARMTQIMNLLNLAPDIQEAVLYLPLTQTGRDRIKEWQLRPMAAVSCWNRQRQMWHNLTK